MTEGPYTELEDSGRAEDGELVHWMQARPLRVGPVGVSATAVGAFVLGMGVALAAMALLHLLHSEPESGPVRRRLF